MGAVTTLKSNNPAPAQLSDAEMIKVLGTSLYPGASPQSIVMVLGYCKAAGLDPMLKPVHLVPMWDSKAKTMRDVVMPGIAHYRVQASRSGQYVGKTEAEFGPDVTEKFGADQVTFPKWCRITVKRAIGGVIAEFTAVEMWKENYATKGKDSNVPNAMWQKRPYAQLAKCAEAQALRMAFPELIGGQNTAEEMEGREIDASPAEPPRTLPAATKQKPRSAEQQLNSFSNVQAEEPDHDEMIDAEYAEIDSADLPEMPDDIRAEWVERKRWMKAWKWFSQTIFELPEGDRILFANQNHELTDAVRSYNENYASACDALFAKAGLNRN